MRLLFVLEKLNDGGITNVLIHRLNYLAENTAHEIFLLTEFKNDIQIVKRLNKKVNIDCLDFDNLYIKPSLPFNLNYFFILKKAKDRLQSFIQELKPDIITSFDIGYSRSIMPRIKTNAKKIIEFHNSYLGIQMREKVHLKSFIQKLKTKVRHPISRERLHNKYDYAITLTEEDKIDRDYLTIKKKQIYNPLPFKNFIDKTPFDKRSNIIIGIGRLSFQKHFEEIIEATNLIKDNMEDWEIHIYGKGDRMQLLTEKIQEYNLGNIIFLKGYSRDITQVYNDSKILVSTSRFEGHPMNILEAFCYDIPVISYDCKCGPKETIINDINGYLIKPNIEVLADKILTLITDKKKLNAFSDQTKLHLHKFHESKIMVEWEDFYQSLNS